jgi:hypothetical protein
VPLWHLLGGQMKIKNILNSLLYKKNESLNFFEYLTTAIKNFKWTKAEKKKFNNLLIEYITDTIKNSKDFEINKQLSSYLLILFPKNNESVIEDLKDYSSAYIIHFIKSIFANLNENYNRNEVHKIFILLAQHNFSAILNVSLDKPESKFGNELWELLFDLYLNYGLNYFESQLKLLTSANVLTLYNDNKSTHLFNFKKVIFETIELNKNQFVKKFHYKYFDIINSNEYKTFITQNQLRHLPIRNIIFDLMMNGYYSPNIYIVLKQLYKHNSDELINYLYFNSDITYNIILYSLIPEYKEVLKLFLSLIIKVKNRKNLISVLECINNGFSIEEKENFLKLLLDEKNNNVLFNYNEISDIFFEVQKNIYLNKKIYVTYDIQTILESLNKMKDKNFFFIKLKKGLLKFLNDFIKTTAVELDKVVYLDKDNSIINFNKIKKYRHYIHSIIDICYRFYYANYNETNEREESVAYIRAGFINTENDYENEIIKNVCEILSSNNFILFENSNLQSKIFEYLEKYIINRFMRFSRESATPYSDKIELVNKLLSISKKYLNNCDDLFDNIKNVIENGNLESYYDYIMEHISSIENLKFIEEIDLKKLKKRFVSDNYYSITFNEALKHINITTIKLIGNITVMEGDCAKTTGNIIYLPSKIDYFKDTKYPLSKNRNLSYYIALTIHEISHLTGGTFTVNPFKFLRENFKYYRLAADIHNIIEDYRCEEYFKEIHPEEEYRLLLENLNRHILSKSIYISDPLKLFLFDVCNYFNTRNHLNEFYTNDKIELTEFLNTATKSEKCREKKLNTYKEMVEWFYSLISKMKISNPASALKFVDLFYEIISAEFMNYLKDYKLCFVNEKTEEEVEAEENNEEPAPVTKEDLENWYEALDKINDSDTCDFSEITPEEIDSLMNQKGIIDIGRRTLADETNAMKIVDSACGQNNNSFKITQKKSEKEKVLDLSTLSSREREMMLSLKNIREFEIKNTDNKCLKKFEEFAHIIRSIEEDIGLLFYNGVDVEYTAEEGEMIVDRYIDSLGSNNSSMPDIYRQFIQNFGTIKVIIGLDASGSTRSSVDNGSSVIDIEKQFAYVMFKSFVHFCDDVELYAFNSVSSTNVYKFSKVENLSALYPDAANRDGDFIRYITKKFEGCQTDRKIFIMLSDGMPASQNYYGEEALSDTAYAMRACKESGISLIYFNIDSHPSGYYPSLAKESTFSMNFQNPKQLLSICKDMVMRVIENNF